MGPYQEQKQTSLPPDADGTTQAQNLDLHIDMVLAHRGWKMTHMEIHMEYRKGALLWDEADSFLEYENYYDTVFSFLFLSYV